MNKFKALMTLDPSRARSQLLGAFKRANCHHGDAAKLLGASRYSFIRWTKELGLVDRLEQMEKTAEQEGWHHGRRGGAAFHRDRGERARKASATFAAKRAAKEASSERS